MAPMSAAHCILFFRFEQKANVPGVGQKTGFKKCKLLAWSLRMKQRYWSPNLYRLGLKPIVCLFVRLVAYLSSYHEKAINALYELA